MTLLTGVSYKKFVEDLGDLIMFARGELKSGKVLMDSLEEFKNVSGLVPCIPTSTPFFCNVDGHVKNTIIQLMPFEQGVLPIKYLGVPLVSLRLLHKDCKIIVERVHNRIGDWKNKCLSFLGRMQLDIYVLSSMHGYWASIFILPVRIIHDIAQLLSGFLLCQGEMKRGKAKVSWESLCMSKQEGDQASAWFDTWATHTSLITHMSNKNDTDVDFSYDVKVADIVENGTWKWPLAWYDMFPILNKIAIPNIDENKQDNLFWKNINETLCEFSVQNVWDTIRVQRDKVPWFRIVGSPFSIPRHTFHMWLVMERKLKTHDKLRQ
ncbi:reverse transcriptase domain, reverse transcriptase zinc-binding domain protein [Tanacetum coccineum]